MNMKKRTLIACIVAALMIGTVAGAAGNETISALLNRTIRIVYNGEEQTFDNGAGTQVYPISYNGTTYLPVRAVSKLVNLPIEWDADNNTVILGSEASQPKNLVDCENTGGTEYNWIITDKSELTITGTDANQPYTTGVQWRIWNSSASTGKARMNYFTVAGYSEVKFTAWSDANCTVKVYDQDYKVITSFDLPANSLTSKTISLNGATKIAIGADNVRAGEPAATLKVLDPIITK